MFKLSLLLFTSVSLAYSLISKGEVTCKNEELKWARCNEVFIKEKRQADPVARIQDIKNFRECTGPVTCKGLTKTVTSLLENEMVNLEYSNQVHCDSVPGYPTLAYMCYSAETLDLVSCRIRMGYTWYCENVQTTMPY